MTSESPACIHNVLDGNINEFILTEASRRAIDELFNMVEALQIDAANNNPEAQTTPALADVRAGFPPLNYAFVRLRPIMTRYPLMRRARVAMITPPSPLLQTVSMIMRSVMPIRVYTPSERDLALAWLRQAPPFNS